jgi:putative glycosyltransferase (TIGR04372 family)
MKKLISSTKLISKISRRYKSAVQKFPLRITNLAFGGKFNDFTNQQSTTVKYSGIFGKNALLDIQGIYSEWEFSENLWNSGHYKKSCEIQKNCLESIYRSQKLDDEDQVPPFLSIGWSAAIGHIGSLGAYVAGQKLGIIPELKRFLPVTSAEQSMRIHAIFQEKVTVLKLAHSFSILESPSQWHLSDRLPMIRTSDSFISLYEMHERVYSAMRIANVKSGVSLSEDYEVTARDILSKLGLPDTAWFVGFHIREEPNLLDPRVARLENFLPALEHVVSRGGWIVRFGAGEMKPLKPFKNVLDLNLNTEENRYLHSYILAKSKFLLTTNSGPSVLAWAFGTPVLQTNTLSIGRNILTASKGSMYLPKLWKHNGQSMSYAQVVTSLEGYNETDLRQKANDGYLLQENSQDEILDATKEMFRFFENEKRDATLTSKLYSIRQDLNVVGFGEIPISFLEKHESWFLK